MVKSILIFLIIFLTLFISANFNFYYKNLHPVSSKIVTYATSTPNTLTVPSLDITAPIIYATSADEDIVQADLKSGVVHYANTASPGQAGNCYIFGHSSDFFWSQGQYKNIFATLPRVKIGDKILVSGNNGNIYTYVVDEAKIVWPSQTEYLAQDYSKKQLTLQTSYPAGTALQRFLVIASLSPGVDKK